MVVQSNFVADELLSVFVSRSENLFLPDTAYIAISNARVEVFSNDRLLEKLIFTTNANGLFYQSREFRPRINVPYQLRVTAPGLEPVVSESRIPGPVELLEARARDVVVQSIPESPDLQYNFTVDLAFSDPIDAENFYHLLFFQRKLVIEEGDEEPSIRIEQRPFLINTINNNNSFKPYYRGGILINDANSNGRTYNYSFRFGIRLQQPNEIMDQFIVELRTTSDEYFQFHNSLNNLNNGSGEPFSESAIVFNNIEAGYGIFAGYSRVVDSLTVVE